MSGYAEEHNIQVETVDYPAPRGRRPDLSSFFSYMDALEPRGMPERPQNNPHARPMPSDVSALYSQAAMVYRQMVGVDLESQLGLETIHGEVSQDEVLVQIIEHLMAGVTNPPSQINGVSDSFLEALERVPREKLAPTDSCPICSNPFLDEEYPLVVRLPCHKDHLFDLECISPWLKLNSTCPLDRQDLLKKKEPVKPAVKDDDEEEDYDDMFA